MLEGRCHNIELPVKLKDIHMLSKKEWLITDSDSNKKFIVSESLEGPMTYNLRPVEETWQSEFQQGEGFFFPNQKVGKANPARQFWDWFSLLFSVL